MAADGTKGGWRSWVWDPEKLLRHPPCRPIQAIAYRVLTSQPQRTQTREKLIAIVQMACWAAPFPLAQSAPAQGIDKAVDWASRIESVVAQGRNLAAGSRPVVAHRHRGTHDMLGVRRSGAHD